MHTGSKQTPRLAYIAVRFPKITETFNLREMRYMQAHGCHLQSYSLLRPARDAKIHPEARDLAATTRYSSWTGDAAPWRAFGYFLRTCPGRLFGALSRSLIGSLRQPVTMLKTLAIWPKSLSFARLSLRDGISHVHATFASHNATCAMLISEITGIPFSFTIDAYDLYVENALLYRKLQSACFVTTISEFNLKVLNQRYGVRHTGHVHVIRRGIDTDRYRPPAARDASGALPEILCVGALQVKKGHIYLLRAVRQLLDQGLQQRCMLVGSGPLESSLRRHIRRLGLESNVYLCGDATQEEVIARMQAADCFVLPSIVARGNRMEGIPNVLMEALACGLPAIGTDLSGTPELIEHGKNGLLVAPADAQALADAITRILHDREAAKKLGQAGRRTVQDKFNLETNVGRLLALYQQAEFQARPESSSASDP